MTTSSTTRLRWSWKSSAFAFLVSVSPVLFQMTTDHRDLLTAAAASNGLTIAPAALVTAVCFYTSWRISAASSPTWLVAGTAVLGVQSVGLAALQVTSPQQTAQQHGWMALADLVLLATVLVLRAADGTAVMRRYPTVIGAAAGLGVGLLRVSAVSRFPHIDPAMPQRLLVAITGVSLATAVAVLILRSVPVALVVRERIVIAMLLLTAGHTVTSLDGGGAHAVNIMVGLGCSVLAAVGFFGAAVGVLRRTLLEENGITTTLRSRLQVVEADERRHRARIHEIESMTAGIVSASELLRRRDGIPADRRESLEQMMHEELGRLERHLRAAHRARVAAGAGPGPSWSEMPGHQRCVRAEDSEQSVVVVPLEPPAPAEDAPACVDLDRTIGHLALAHEAKGTAVSWRPSGSRVYASADDLAEVLNILLDNAARHGDASAAIAVREAPHAIEILVTDHGPGIAPEVRDQLFQWGARGPDSPGQGIGLNIAHELMERSGGYLRLRETGPGESGATFVVGLPRAEVSDGILA